MRLDGDWEEFKNRVSFSELQVDTWVLLKIISKSRVSSTPKPFRWHFSTCLSEFTRQTPANSHSLGTQQAQGYPHGQQGQPLRGWTQERSLHRPWKWAWAVVLGICVSNLVCVWARNWGSGSMDGYVPLTHGLFSSGEGDKTVLLEWGGPRQGPLLSWSKGKTALKLGQKECFSDLFK